MVEMLWVAGVIYNADPLEVENIVGDIHMGKQQ